MRRAPKPRVHWVSPLPPAQTDIAHYTARILPELAAATDLTLWTDAPTWDRHLHDIARVRWLDPDRVTPRDFALAGRAVPGRGPEVVFVNIGNAWPFHAGFMRLLQRIPSVVILHDMAIQEMCLDAIERDLFSEDLYRQQIAAQHGAAGLALAEAALADMAARPALVAAHPGFELALPRAVSVLTHTPVARDAVAAWGPLPTYLLDLPFRPAATRPELIRSRVGGLRLIQFGHTGPNRRLAEVLEALAPLRDEIAFRFDIYGTLWDPPHIHRRIAELGLSHHVQVHGFVPEADLDAALARAHLAFNLRNPTMGEASGSQMRIWNAGVPGVVTDLGWYAGLPDAAVFKIAPEAETPALQDLLRHLAADPALGRDIAAAGQARLTAHHAPDVYTKGLLKVVRNFATDAAQAGHIRPAHPLPEGDFS